MFHCKGTDFLACIYAENGGDCFSQTYVHCQIIRTEADRSGLILPGMLRLFYYMGLFTNTRVKEHLDAGRSFENQTPHFA